MLNTGTFIINYNDTQSVAPTIVCIIPIIVVIIASVLEGIASYYKSL